MTTAKKTGLELLREPFEPHQIGKLPKPSRADAPKGRCEECHGWHGLPAVHLDYVGHAALTDRLLNADPQWSWEPLAVGPDGLPVFDKSGGLWIRLTVCGVTRLGYGDSGGKQGGNAVKEAIGDALRNAGMRFGAALDLWHKGDLHEMASAGPEPGREATNSPSKGVKAAPKNLPAQKPIAATQATEDWIAAADKCKTVDQLRDLYETVAAAGELGVQVQGKVVGQYIIDTADILNTAATLDLKEAEDDGTTVA